MGTGSPPLRPSSDPESRPDLTCPGSRHEETGQGHTWGSGPMGTVAPQATSAPGPSHPFLSLSVPREPLATSPFQGPEPRTRAQPGPWVGEAGVTTPFHHFYSFHCLPSVPRPPPGSPPPRITPAAIPECSREMEARSHSAAGGTVKTLPCWWRAGGRSQLWGMRQKSVIQ